MSVNNTDISNINQIAVGNCKEADDGPPCTKLDFSNMFMSDDDQESEEDVGSFAVCITQY